MICGFVSSVGEYLITFVRFVWIIQSVQYGVFSYLAFVLLLRPIRCVLPRQFSRIERWLCNKLCGMVSSWVGSCGHHSKLY